MLLSYPEAVHILTGRTRTDDGSHIRCYNRLICFAGIKTNIWLRLYCHINSKSPCGKSHPQTIHEGPEMEYRHSPTLSLISVIDSRWVVNATPCRFTPWKEAVDIKRQGGFPRRSGRVRIISPGLDPRTVQSVASRYID